jgi:hypothetical protein
MVFWSKKLIRQAGGNTSGTELDYCEECFEKQRRIDILEDENKQLKAQLNYREKQNQAGFFGSSTPSSKQPIKENTLEENQQKIGGAKAGHKGNGRKEITKDSADEIIEVPFGDGNCPNCGGKLKKQDTIFRGIVDTVLTKAKNIIYACEKMICTECGKTFESKPLILPKNKYGNNLISDSAIMCFFQGFPLKRIENLWGEKVVPGVLIKIFHRLAELWKPAIAGIIKDYRNSPAKHADETGWRIDGQSGYAWLFCNKDTSLFAFRDNRSSRIPKEILGNKKIPGVLIVDRYSGYNRSPCKIQYCYAHLLRDLKDLEEEFEEDEEVQQFVSNLVPLLAAAMHLQSKPISDKKYYIEARKIKKGIQEIINAPAKHLAIVNYQDIFRDKAKRMYHWVNNREVAAHNNRAERELRPTVIARKVSFGSQSKNGAATREILMTIIHTAAKRLKANNSNQTLEEWFKWTIEEFIKNPEVDPYSLLPKLK